MATEAEIKEALTQCFNSIDTDCSGSLDKKEVLKVLKAYNNSSSCRCKKTEKQLEDDVKGFVKEVDKNNDNKISKDEFLDFFIKLLK